MAVRYAIIGSGCMGQEHIRYLQLLDGAEVCAIADPDEGMRAVAVQLGGAGVAAYADYRQMLAEQAIDALIVATPNHTHAAVLEDVLASNLPLLVEKPLCTTVDDCRRVQRLAHGRRAPVWVAMEYRYMPPVQDFLKAMADGAIGALKTLSIIEHRYPFLQKVGDWSRFNRNTGGTLVEKCCHFFDLMRLMTGAEPVRVYASGGIDVNHLDERYDGEAPDILDNAMVIVDFDSGVRAYLELNMFAEGSRYQEHITAIGDRAKLEIRIPGPARLWPGALEREADITLSPRFDKAPVTRVVPVDESLLLAGDHHGSTFFQHQRFLETIRTGARPEVGLDDGARAVEIGAAAEQSVASGQPVLLSPGA